MKLLDGFKALCSSSFVENDANQRSAGMELTPVTALNTKVQPEQSKENVQITVKLTKIHWQSFFSIVEVPGPGFATTEKNILKDNCFFHDLKRKLSKY